MKKYLLILLLIITTNIFSTTWYMSSYATDGTGDCLSWENAGYNGYIRDSVIVKNLKPGDSILFADTTTWGFAGRYDSIFFIGGYDGKGPTPYHKETNIDSITTGLNLYYDAICTNCYFENMGPNSTLRGIRDGCTIVNAKGYIYMVGKNITLKKYINGLDGLHIDGYVDDLTVDSCVINYLILGAYDNSTVKITNSLIKDFSIGDYADLYVKNTTFGHSFSFGTSSDVYLENIQFPVGDGVAFSNPNAGSCDITMKNIYQSGAPGHGINIGGTSGYAKIRIYNCAFTYNDNYGANLDMQSTDSVIIVNSIFMNNKGGKNLSITGNPNTILKNNITSNDAKVYFYQRFLGQALLDSSVDAIDKGIMYTGVPELDYYGNPISGIAKDIGPYEAKETPKAYDVYGSVKWNKKYYEDINYTTTIALNGVYHDGTITKYVLASTPTKGTASLTATGDSVIYATNHDYSQPTDSKDSLTYFAINNNGDTSNVAKVIITLLANKPPVITDPNISAEVLINTQTSFILSATDEDGYIDTYASTPTTPHGTVKINKDTLFYTPNTDYLGADTVKYLATDNDGNLSDYGYIYITVSKTNLVQTMQEKNPELLLLYPNPTIKYLSYTSKILGELYIYSNTQQELIKLHQGLNDISNLPTGIYYGVIKDGKKIKAVKSFYKK